MGDGRRWRDLPWEVEEAIHNLACLDLPCFRASSKAREEIQYSNRNSHLNDRSGPLIPPAIQSTRLQVGFVTVLLLSCYCSALYCTLIRIVLSCYAPLPDSPDHQATSINHHVFFASRWPDFQLLNSAVLISICSIYLSNSIQYSELSPTIQVPIQITFKSTQ